MLQSQAASQSHQTFLLCALGLGAAAAAVGLWFAAGQQQRGWRRHAAHAASLVDGVAGAIGNTPLIRIHSLSQATGCEASGSAVGWAACVGHDLRRPQYTSPGLPSCLPCLPVCLSQILGKAEFLNPGGSVKDRVALRIIQEALVSSKQLAGCCIQLRLCSLASRACCSTALCRQLQLL
jgi:hypothetical protein